MRAQPQVPSLCIDETSLSCGELYTVVTNRAGRGVLLANVYWTLAMEIPSIRAAKV